MSSLDARRDSRRLVVAVACLLTGSLGCWEQWSNDWFPQMKRQPAVQAFEEVTFAGQVAAFLPPEGTIPVDGGEAPVDNKVDSASDHLVNPQSMGMASLENGRHGFDTYCAPCHGSGGLGDGPVSMTGPIQGPIAAVLPLAGPGSIAKVRSDGHIYTTIRYGRRRMPGYARITARDRWDIVNYIRYLNEQKGVGG